MKILVVEDEPRAAEYLRQGLAESGYTVEVAGNGTDGLHAALNGDHSIVILDVMLPGVDGFAVLSALRTAKHVPVLMLTARDRVDDKVRGFDLGADDYLVKPFDINELEARLQALLRRSRRQVADAVLRVGDLTLDTGTLEARRAGRILTLTPTALGLLETLMRASPRVLSRAELEFALWGDEPPDSDALRSHMYLLRRAVDKDATTPLVHTLKHRGYRVARLDEAER